MRRRALIGLGVVAVILAGVLAGAKVYGTRLAERYRPDIERAATSALGAPVRLGALRVSMLPGVHVAIDQVSVGSGDLTLRDVELHLRLLPLLHGAFDVTTLALDAPHLTLLRDTRGVTLEGLPRPAAAPAGGGPATGSQGAAGGSPLPPALALDIRRFQIRHGTVELKDLVRKTTIVLRELAVDAALVVDAHGIHLPEVRTTGTLTDVGVVAIDGHDLAFDPGTGIMEVPGLTVGVVGNSVAVEAHFDVGTASGGAIIRSKGIDLAKMAPLLALASVDTKRLGLHGMVTPDLRAKIGQGYAYEVTGTVELADLALDAGAAAIRKLHGTLDVATRGGGTTVGSRDLALELGGKPVVATLASSLLGDTATLQELVVTAFGGTTRVSGTYALASRHFAADLGADGIDLGALEGAVDPRTSPRVLGTLARAQAKLAGTTGADMERSLGGSGSAQLNNVRVPGVNVVGDVLKQLRTLPLATAIKLPPEVQAEAAASETVITSLTADFTIGGAALHLQRMVAASPSFGVDGAGRVGFDASLDLSGTIRLSQALSRSIVAGTKELALALGDDGRIAIPLAVRGTPPKVAVIPDVTRLVGSGIGRAAGGLLKGLGDLLKKR